MPSFKEYEPDYYEVELFEPIVDFDKDQYGNEWFNVKFVGDAETFMWLKKDPPVEGQKYYGHIEKTKSGKRLRFKTDKVPEDIKPSSTSSAVKDTKYQRDITSIPLDVWRTLVGIQGVPENQSQFTEFFLTVQQHANELLLMIENVRSGGDNSPRVTNEPKSPAAAGPSLRKRWDEAKDGPTEEPDERP